MEIIRGIFDQSDVGIVIAGEPRLEAEIKGNLARFANRMDFYYKPKGLSPQEVKDYMEGYDVDDAAMMEFISRATNAQTGCFRLLDRTLNNVIPYSEREWANTDYDEDCQSGIQYDDVVKGGGHIEETDIFTCYCISHPYSICINRV